MIKIVALVSNEENIRVKTEGYEIASFQTFSPLTQFDAKSIDFNNNGGYDVVVGTTTLKTKVGNMKPIFEII